MAEKFIQGNIKKTTINGVDFLFRKINPEDAFFMMQNLEAVKCKDCDDDDKLSSEQLQQLMMMDRKLIFTRCVLSPKIVDKPYGEQGENEIPYELLDSETSMKLFEVIQRYSTEVIEGVDLESFLEEQDGKGRDKDESIHGDSAKPDNNELSGSKSTNKNVSGQSVRKNKRRRKQKNKQKV